MKDKAREPVSFDVDGYKVSQCHSCGIVTVERDGVCIKVLSDGLDLTRESAFRFVMAAKRPTYA